QEIAGSSGGLRRHPATLAFCFPGCARDTPSRCTARRGSLIRAMLSGKALSKVFGEWSKGHPLIDLRNAWLVKPTAFAGHPAGYGRPVTAQPARLVAAPEVFVLPCPTVRD